MMFSVDLNPELIPCEVRDAHGNKIHDIVAGDAETGVCTCFVRDENNQLVIDEDALARKIVIAKAPLTIHPL